MVSDAGWVHVYNTTGAVSVARRAAEAVLRGPQEHVAECVAELERRRDTILAALPGLADRAPGGRVVAAGRDVVDGSPRRRCMAAGVAATPMTGWGGDVAARYVRFVFSRRAGRALA